MENRSAFDAVRETLLPGDRQSPPLDACAPADQIYLEHGPLLRRVAIRKFRVPAADADALVHDVFVNYLLSPGRVHSNLRAYLVAGICNACRNYWRSRHSEDRVFADEAPPEKDLRLDEELFDGLATNLIVASTLAKLGERCREALKRYYLRGEDTGSIAATLNTTASNVNYLMHVCRKRARVVYETMITRTR